MCKGSTWVLHKSAAEFGESYCVSNGGDGSVVVAVLHLPEFGHREKDARIVCAACIEVPTAVEVTNVPIAIQEKYGIGPTLRGIFVPGGNMHDEVDFIQAANGAEVLFNDLIDQDVRLELRTMSSVAHASETLERELVPA